MRKILMGTALAAVFSLLLTTALAQIQPPPCATNPIATDYCNIATPICNLNGYCGNTSSFYTNHVSATNSTSENLTPLGNVFCATIQNNSWLKFIADSTVAIFSVWCSNCVHNHGIQMQIYATTDCYNFIPKSNCWNPMVPTNGQIIATNLTPGNVYYFMIDGTMGDNCDYVIACDVGVNPAPAVSLNQTICSGVTTTVAATGGVTYVWSSNPPDPSMNGQQTNAVLNVSPSTTTTYTVTVSNPGLNTFCATDTSILSTIVTVNNVSAQVVNITPTHCNLNNGSLTVAGTGSTGAYTYLWNTSPPQTTPTISGLSPGTYVVTISNAGCSTAASLVVPAVPVPVVTIPTFTNSFCNQANGSAIAQVSGGTPPFTYSWNTTPAQSTSTLSNVNGGVYTITVTDSANCLATHTVTITDIPGPTVTLTPFASVCQNQNPFSLSGGSPPGGTYSGTGIAGNVFSPSTAGSGTHTITYSYTDVNGCSGFANRPIQVLSVPVVAFPPPAATCANSPPTTLTGGSPAGGTYSGGGVSGGMFNPQVQGPGAFPITYSFTGTNGCTGSVTQNIAVFPVPAVTLAPLPGTCINSQPLMLSGGNPAGGTFSGPGVSGGSFNPATTGIGSFTLTYSFTDLNNCTNTATQSITVHDLPVVTLAPIPDVCVNAGLTYLLGGSPPGGTYTGTGIISGLFNPALSGTGTFQLVYHYADAFGCTSSDTGTITVHALPAVTFPSPGELCADAQPLVLTGGLPAGGTYVGAGVTAGAFDPSVTGPGTFPVGYAVSDTIGCTDTAYQSLLVRPLPTVLLSPFTEICVDAGIQTLSGGTPAGGTYSGPGVSNGTYDPLANGPGLFPITYTYTDPFGCTNDTTSDFTVNPLPEAFHLTGGGTVCEGTGGAPLGLDSSQAGVEYTVFLNGFINGFPYIGSGAAFSFSNQTQPGMYYIKAQDPVTGCVNYMADTLEVKILPAPEVDLGDTLYLCDLPQILLDAGTYPDTIAYEWQDGSFDRYYAVTEPGTYWVKVYLGNCFGRDSIDVEDCSSLIIPNVFTPNGDLSNDRFKPKQTGEILDYNIEIFNRWGKKVYESPDLEEGWDGTMFNKGTECSEGVYYFVASYVALIYPQPNRHTKLTGSVTLLK